MRFDYPDLSDDAAWEDAAETKIPTSGKFKVVELDYFDYTDASYGEYGTLAEARIARDKLNNALPDSSRSLIKYYIYDHLGTFVE